MYQAMEAASQAVNFLPPGAYLHQMPQFLWSYPMPHTHLCTKSKSQGYERSPRKPYVPRQGGHPFHHVVEVMIPRLREWSHYLKRLPLLVPL